MAAGDRREALLETVGERSAREAREAAAAVLKAEQKSVETGKRVALHEAAMVGDLKRLSTEVAKAADDKQLLDKGDPRGCSAFHLACTGGYVDCVKALVKAGAETNALNAGGSSGWELARQGGKQEVLQLLRRFGQKKHPSLALELELELAAVVEEGMAASILV
jgi:ankyrin repeat protein